MGGLAGGVGQGLTGAPEPGPRRIRARVRGVVQGVGFRPFVYNLARSLGLAGFVTNTAAGVDLAVQGPEEALDRFFHRLQNQPPPLARITGLEQEEEPPRPGEREFRIRHSRSGQRRTLISPDVATCPDCLAELMDPADRRYRYPFINCTNCGPRYTIIKDLPYDRPQTTMAAFTMCPDCLAEYQDPANRRFHAQPNACPHCGPRLWLSDPRGREIACGDPVREAAARLRRGQILALKGLGGFHLAVDAFDSRAVARLRRRKHREEKPLALMVPGVETARELVELDPLSLRALTGLQRPIVICPLRPGTGLAPEVNPGNRSLGLMLPYTPLHHLLMAEGFRALVMTSGNLSEEPICLDNQEALERLGGIADCLLLHDRDIYLRSDDSVVRVVGGRLRQLRRSRGYVPVPLELAPELVPARCPPILALGAHLKNTLCLLRGRQAFLSQHVGDLENLETLEFFQLTAGHLARILEARPRLLACDLHPDYLSSGWAREQGLPLVRVQHHHAHALAVMAEHGLAGPVLALSLDGTGYGPDGTVWGGELLACDRRGYRRLGRLEHLYLPGGEAAVRQPWRVGLALLRQLHGDKAAELDLGLVRQKGRHLELWGRMMEKGLNTPRTSSLGRLFDAAAAVCGLRRQVAYEGQAAVELEQAMDPGERGSYPFALRRKEKGLIILDWRPALRELVAQAAAGVAIPLLAARFHRGLLQGLAAWARAGAQAAGLEQVCLGGGCFLNAFLLEHLPPLLQKAGLAVFSPARVPAGDGGISLGQALAAAAAWEGGEVAAAESRQAGGSN